MMSFAARLAVLLFASTSFAAPETSPIEPPAGAADMAVSWRQVRVPDLGVMVLAIARPSGEGPFPTYALDTGGIRAAVIESAGYTDEQAARIARLEVPLLILHGAGDTSADGGSPFQTPQKARSFEAALRAAGKPVEAVYYEYAGHNTIFTDPKQFDDVVRRIVSFIAQPPETR
jgi:pimeloyl-ACP methyl ester carboxylesterase